MTRRHFTGALAIGAPSLALVGCDQNPIQLLNLAVGGLEILVPLVGPAAGLPPQLLQAIETYANAASGAIAQAADILSSPGLTDAERAAAIVAAFAGIAAPVVPAQFQGIANAVQQVAQYIAKFLAGIPKPAAFPAHAARAVPTHSANASDRTKLAKLKVRAEAVKASLKNR